VKIKNLTGFQNRSGL